MRFERYPGNPIVLPGLHDWRRVTTFNPGVIYTRGAFHMFERACSSLDPLKCQVGWLESPDGFRFRLVSDRPVLAPEDFGTPLGTVEDPRVVEMEGRYLMTFVHRNLSATCRPNGIGVPKYINPANVPPGDLNNYRSGLAASTDLRRWQVLGLITPPEIHDRDNVLFPAKIGGRYAMLRRPENYVGPQYGCDRPSIWLSYSDDLLKWDPPVLVATPRQSWEARKIGAGAPPLLTDAGWLIIYHGVDAHSVYRVGVMLLDRDNPARVVARAPDFVMEPEAYYEKVGLIIPNVVFPSANVLREGTVYVYYGCTDTCIAVATAPLADLLAYVLGFPA
jgi:predicted GH43/DUF377 family glycosyl hydrolase